MCGMLYRIELCGHMCMLSQAELIARVGQNHEYTVYITGSGQPYLSHNVDPTVMNTAIS